jgi:hypothetical protein
MSLRHPIKESWGSRLLLVDDPDGNQLSSASDRADFRARHRFLSRAFDSLLCGALPDVERGGALSARARTGYTPTTSFASSSGNLRLNQRPSLGTLPMLQVSDVADTRVPNSDLRSFLWRSQWQAGVRPVRRLTSRR